MEDSSDLLLLIPQQTNQSVTLIVWQDCTEDFCKLGSSESKVMSYFTVTCCVRVKVISSASAAS